MSLMFWLTDVVGPFGTFQSAKTVESTHHFGVISMSIVNQVSQLYIGILGRAADRAGLEYWVNQVQTGKLTIEGVAKSFQEQPEWINGNGQLDRAGILNELYKNLFGREATGVDKAYWVLGEGASVPLEKLVLALIAPGAALGNDATVLSQRTDAAVNFSFSDADTTDLDAAAAAITGVVSGSTFMLTAGVDTPANTAGNDLYDGTQNSAGAATFTALDTIDGGAGIDTLKIVQAGTVNTTTVAGATVKNVEIIDITGGAGVTANTTAWEGVTNLNIKAAYNVSATASATSDINVTAAALTAGAGDELTVNGGKNVTTTSADTLTLGAGATSSDIVIGGTTAAAGAVKVTHTETVGDAVGAGASTGTTSTVTVTGGTTVEVNSLATVGAAENAGDIVTIGVVAVNGNASTTEVTVKQSAATATYDGTTQKNISIVNGAVNIVDGNAATASDTIKTVTLENFGAAAITSTVLETLNLTAGAAIAGGAVTLTKSAADTSIAATTLALNTSGSFGKISGTQADVYKTVNVTAAAATTIADIEMDELTGLNVGGTGVTTFTALTAAQNAKLATITSTGAGLTIGTELATNVAVTGGAGVENIMIGATTKVIDLGAGDDVVTVSTTTMGAGGAVKGGEGTDTLVANTNGSAFAGLPAFTGFETLRIAGTAAEGAHNAVGFTALELGTTKAAVSSFTDVAAGVGLTVLAAPGGAHTVTLADATGKADSFNLTFKSAGALDLSTNGITLAGVETINITNTDTNTTAHTNKLNLTADSVTSIVVTGNAGLDLSGSTYAKVTNFDASGITGASKDAAALAVTYVSGNTTIGDVVTIKGGSGNDSLTGSATANDTIFGGDGADTLVYDGGADVFHGGAGADTFTVSALGTKTSFLTIADAEKTDILGFANITAAAMADVNAAGMAAAKVTLGAAATFDQYLDAAAAGATGAAAALFSWFQFGGDTYAVVDNTNATVFSATDAVIKLAGLVDLSTSSITGESLTIA